MRDGSVTIPWKSTFGLTLNAAMGVPTTNEVTPTNTNVAGRNPPAGYELQKECANERTRMNAPKYTASFCLPTNPDCVAYMSTAFAPCNASRASTLTTCTSQGAAPRSVLTNRCDLQILTADNKLTSNTVTTVTPTYIVSFLRSFCSQSCQTLPHIRCIRRLELLCVWRETAAARPFGNHVVTYRRLDTILEYTDQTRVHAHV